MSYDSEKQVFVGSFWSRPYESDTDIDAALVSRRIDTPLQCAFVDACTAVEGLHKNLALAAVKVTLTPGGDYRVEAVLEQDRFAVTTRKCGKCAAVVYGDDRSVCHPFNGCEAVLIEEVMEG